MNQRSRIGIRKRIIFSLIVTISFFAVLEIGFRGLEWIYPPRHVDYGLGFNPESRVFVDSPIHSGQMETHSSKRISFVRQRFQRIKPAGTFRIVALGGSSVNYLQSEFQALQRELTEEFKDRFDTVEIINCGGVAYGSHRLVLVFREMLDYDPDMILLYSGHNEFEEVEQLQLANVEQLSFDRTISKSAIIRFIRDRKAAFDLSKLEKQHNQRVLNRVEPVSDENFARAWNHAFTQEDVAQRMEQYEHNLRLILQSAQDQKIPVVIGTVASNLLRPYLPQQASGRYAEVYELWKDDKVKEGIALARQILAETLGRHQCSDLENAIVRQLATDFSVPLVDVESLVAQQEPHGIPGETLFNDHCHLNAAGRAIWISGYATKIRELFGH